MKKFEPIAIIGQGCILPGCSSPQELWKMVYNNQIHISAAQPEAWRVDLNNVLTKPEDTSSANKSWNSQAGYVTHFEDKFDSKSFELDSNMIESLDPVFQWSFNAAQAALKDAGYADSKLRKRTGLIMGNLSYPSRSFSKYFEETHLKRLFPDWKNPAKSTDPTNRFTSGLPAILTSKALGLEGDSFALDAACASSLYALKLACDKLQSGFEDMMLVGGVCASDQLFLHLGFSALNALSPTGQSRPFNQDADGLIPSEGSGFIVIKRLKDAVKSNDNILGVVRGVGLSNDGRKGGFLSPAQSGQMSSMRRAFEMSELKPEDIGYVECHATGTSIGDSIEIKSMQDVYSKTSNLHLSSLKGNIGHSITASGVGSIIKVLGAFKNKTLPPVPNAYPLNNTLSESSFTISDKPLKWVSNKNRIAGINNFGFGGNNAHVLIEEWNPKTKYSIQNKKTKKQKKVAIVGLEIQTNLLKNSVSYLKHLLGDTSAIDPVNNVKFVLNDLGSPPNDLKYALSQQLLILNTTQNLLKQNVSLSKERTGVFIGMGVDADINRYGFRKRIAELLNSGTVTDDLIDSVNLEEQIGPVLNSAGVLGTMPNISANRINNQFDFSGLGFTISCEELSGNKSLDIAIQAIQNEELDTAIVGAVDMSREFVNEMALREVLGVEGPTSDAAVVMLLKNYDQAIIDEDNILAAIDSSENSSENLKIDKDWVRSKIGYSHACSGLIDIATALLLTKNRLQLTKDNTGLRPILENDKGFTYSIENSSYFGGKSNFNLYSEPIKDVNTRTTCELLIHCYSAKNRESLIQEVQNNRQSKNGPCRLAILTKDRKLNAQRELATKLLNQNSEIKGWITPNIFYESEKISGETAFVFTGAASAYSKMGQDLIEEFPGLISKLQPYCNNSSFAGEWIYNTPDPKSKLPFYQLAGSSLLCQVHAKFTKNILGIKPDAAIGLSSGETNSMYALGVWDDMDELLKEIYESELYDSALGVDFKSISEYWGLKTNEKVEWENWRILAPIADVKKALLTEERAYLTIINTNDDCVIGGDRSACSRILSMIGENNAMPLGHDIAVHCPAVAPFENVWRTLHTRKVNKVENIRFYSNFLDGVYEPTSSSVADALTGQALNPIDFPKIINKAWDDGVRIFIEHGPRNSLKSAIEVILRNKDFLCVSMDQAGQSSLVQSFKVAAELWARGVDVNLETLSANIIEETLPSAEIKFPFHPPEIEFQKVSALNRKAEQTTTHSTQESKNTMKKAPQRNQVKRNKPYVEVASEGIKDVSETEKQLSNTIGQEENEAQNSKANLVSDSPDSAIELLKKQHSATLEAHQHYLAAQLKGQLHYNELANQMMNQLTGLRGSNNSNLDEIVHQDSADTSNSQVVSTEPIPGQFSGVEIVEPSQNPTKLSYSDANTNQVDSDFPGLKLSKTDLEILASGKISSVLGPLFEKQDRYSIQVRMPEPPLLLCDRVTGLKGEPGTLGLGTIWTETDVTSDSWYLHNNRMPPGIFIEAGQADLLLISYLGIDFQNKGERAYRLLGCELTFHGELPKPGDTLKYDIHVDGYAKSGDTTLFFFHYDCHIDGKLRISVREGQAGFFSAKELDESKGVIWDAATAEYAANGVTSFESSTKRTKFSPEQIEAYTEGDMVTCFGPELDWTCTHTRSPRSQGGYQNFIKNITNFDLLGGPAKRGYLRSETIVSPDDWYFKGHFKNDECMPGTLMADACLQMMAFYMVGTGLTSTKDGWRFEPVSDEKYKFICRGQVTPSSKKVVYEIFVDEIINGDFPTIYAHVLTTVDGNRAFLCERIGLRLVADWPLATMRHLIENDVKGKSIASYKGFKFGQESLMNCALGKPSDAFGSDFEHYKGVIRGPRLPGPPYHFMTRIAEFTGAPGEYNKRPYVITEYDIPDDVWYFSENGKATMPYAVLMEVALQPCGWSSTFFCQNDIKGRDLLFRNLDGTAVQHREINQSDKTIVTKTTLTGVSIMGDIIIVNSEVVCAINDEPVFTMNTVFGFFDPDSMLSQKGLPISAEEQSNLSQKSNCNIDLIPYPKKYFKDSTARLPSSKLLMIDRIVAFHDQGGKYGKGYVKSEKDVEKSEWFFKAHFFRDPVQPGSLGIEAMIQLIQFYILDKGYHKKMNNPSFEPIAITNETEWKYRGQVTPKNKLISVDFEVKEINEEQGSVTVIGEARLWVDGLKIYHALQIGMRIIEEIPALPQHSSLKQEIQETNDVKIATSEAMLNTIYQFRYKGYVNKMGYAFPKTGIIKDEYDDEGINFYIEDNNKITGVCRINILNFENVDSKFYRDYDLSRFEKKYDRFVFVSKLMTESDDFETLRNLCEHVNKYLLEHNIELAIIFSRDELLEMYKFMGFENYFKPFNDSILGKIYPQYLIVK